MISFLSPYGDTIELPNPEFGDKDTINFKRVNRESRGNDLIIAGQAGWPSPTRLLNYEFQGLAEAKKELLKSFLARHVGIPVTLTDHYGVQWYVIFLRPDAEFSQVGVENRTVTLDMQVIQ